MGSSFDKLAIAHQRGHHDITEFIDRLECDLERNHLLLDERTELGTYLLSCVILIKHWHLKTLNKLLDLLAKCDCTVLMNNRTISAVNARTKVAMMMRKLIPQQLVNPVAKDHVGCVLNGECHVLLHLMSVS